MTRVLSNSQDKIHLFRGNQQRTNKQPSGHKFSIHKGSCITDITQMALIMIFYLFSPQAVLKTGTVILQCNTNQDQQPTVNNAAAQWGCHAVNSG